MVEIVPSPGTENKNWPEIETKINAVKPFVKTIHIDICDGKFTPNTTFADTDAFKKYITDMAISRSGWVAEDKGIIFEVHLMVEEPITHLKKWADAGFTRFIGQIEKMSSQEEFIAEAQLLGEAGLGVDGPTELEKVTVPYDDLDVMLFYTGERAGLSGAALREDRLEKVKALRKLNEYLPVEADGGINDETIAVAYEAGVTRFVTTGFLFGIDTPEKQYLLLEKKLQELTSTQQR